MNDDNPFESNSTITLKRSGGYTVDVPLPSKCPICHHFSSVQWIANTHSDFRPQAVFQCGYPGCSMYFVATYGISHARNFEIFGLYPRQHEKRQFSESIVTISPKFVTVFHEADHALSLNLQQIAGPGFRKAVEFLIKDYAISQNVDDTENIKKSFASSVVDNYIKDARIQKVAKRAFWLGNDETHYLRVWEEKNIDDLKTLISLTVNYIEIEFQSRGYEEDMPDRKGS